MPKKKPKKQQKIQRKKKVAKVLLRKNNVEVKKPTSKTERWKQISGFEGYYEVSTMGRVRSMKRVVDYSDGRPNRNLSSRIVKDTFDKDGYKTIHLNKGGEQFSFKVHRLVASAFIPNPKNLTDVNHKNEVKDDNRVSNLEWCTHEYNMNYGSRSKKASEAATQFMYQRFTIKGEYIDSLSYQDIIKEGFDYGFVAKAAQGIHRSAYGLIWKRIPIEEYRENVIPKLRKNGVVVNKPTSSTGWKSLERRIADMFGTKRVPLSGSNSGHNTNSDSLHPKLYIECKLRQKIAIWQLFEDTERKAKAEDKIPIVAIKQKGAKGELLVIRPHDLQKIAEIQREGEKIK